MCDFVQNKLNMGVSYDAGGELIQMEEIRLIVRKYCTKFAPNPL